MGTNITYYQRYITEEEKDKILEYLSKNIFWSLVFNIMFYMGLRTIEVCRIRYSDIFNDFSMLRVKLAKSARIKDRVIPDRVRPLLRLYCQAFQPEGHDFLFHPLPQGHSKNEHIQTSSIRWVMKKIRQDLGISDKYYKNYDRICCHACRSYFLTRVFEITGNDLVTAQRIIGHSKPGITANYIRPKKEEWVASKI